MKLNENEVDIHDKLYEHDISMSKYNVNVIN